MSLRTLLLAPITSALTGALVLGLVSLVPAPAVAAPQEPSANTKADGLTQSKTRFARSSYLCYGYANCRKAGMGPSGYAGANDKMYWQMYSGHNCTNYAAFRMIRSGLPNKRPWSGGGNATYWGTSMPKITDDVPSVGAVAWWRANKGPAGSAGHVAYVERVISADEVVVSQDSWGGDFSWAVITRASGNWPSGFIHFNDVGLSNKQGPVVSGTVKVGSQLTASSGKWKPASADVSYQWFADGSKLKKATGQTLTLGKKRLGQVITVATTGTKLGYGHKTVSSAPTTTVLPGVLQNAAKPAISGESRVDRTLSVAGGTWSPAPDKVTTQWFADGTPLTGATGSTLRLTPDLVDRVITATITATRTGYDPVTVTTAATSAVAPGTLATTRAPVISGQARPRQTLVLDTGAFRPVDAAAAVQWLLDGEPVRNAIGPTYLLAGEDLGARISARVTVTRPGYLPSILTTAPTARIRATPRVSFVREKLKHRALVTVTVSSEFVADVTGTVVVRVAGGFRKEVTVRHGVAKVSVRDLPKGKRAMRVTYQGGLTLERVKRTGHVFLPRAR